MAQIIGLPKLSPTMEEGVLVRWTRRRATRSSPGDLVAEVETDKANMDFNIEDEGVLLKLLVKEGDTVKLGAPVAILGKAGEDVSALVAQAQRRGGGGAAQPRRAPKPRRAEAEPKPREAPAPRGEGRARRRRRAPPQKPRRAAAPRRRPRRAATPQPPRARRQAPRLAAREALAIELGIDLRNVQRHRARAAASSSATCARPPSGGDGRRQRARRHDAEAATAAPTTPTTQPTGARRAPRAPDDARRRRRLRRTCPRRTCASGSPRASPRPSATSRTST